MYLIEVYLFIYLFIQVPHGFHEGTLREGGVHFDFQRAMKIYTYAKVWLRKNRKERKKQQTITLYNSER